MANNRMYLICDVCETGDFTTALYLGKRLGSGYYTTKTVNEDYINKFFDTHEWCGNTLDHFSIKYEIGRE